MSDASQVLRQEVLTQVMGASQPLSPLCHANSPTGVDHQHNDSSTISSAHQHYIVPSDTVLETGSSVSGAIFNFTNSIIGAGAIGLGGAFAQSGGFLSIISILFFAGLTKLSLDLVIQLSLEQQQLHGTQNLLTRRGVASFLSYEELGRCSFGQPGQLLVLLSKLFYSLGCLVAYVIVVKDNFAPAVQSLIYNNGNDSHQNDAVYTFLSHEDWVTWVVSCAIVLPLCLLRDMTPLAAASVLGIVAMLAIVGIVSYLFILNPNNTIRQNGGTFHEKWLDCHFRGYLECLGTFVFTFVSQHTAHMTFQSLQPSLRTLSNWQRITSSSIVIASIVSLSVGIFVYMTFWSKTQSDIFQLYPHLWIIDWAKLLLCIDMLVTFPLPFFTCRELLIVLLTTLDSRANTVLDDLIDPPNGGPQSGKYTRFLDDNDEHQLLFLHPYDLEIPLLASQPNEVNNNGLATTPTTATEISTPKFRSISVYCTKLLLPGLGHEKQLQLPFHILLTVLLWLVVTALAISAPNLGDVLALVGCATGTLIAFVFPACFALKLQPPMQTQRCRCQRTILALVILVVGGVVGMVGTVFSMRKLIADL